jgi:hypothetical protein
VSILRNDESRFFADYIQTVFRPRIADLRRNRQLSNKKAVLLTDRSLSHVAREIVKCLTDADVLVVTFARRATHFFQFRGLAFFAVLKQCQENRLSFIDEKGTAEYIKNVSQDFRGMMIFHLLSSLRFNAPSSAR